MWDSIVQFFDKGGIVMVLLLCLSLYAWWIIVRKSLLFYRLQPLDRRICESLHHNPNCNSLKNDLATSAITYNPTAKVLLSAVTEISKPNYEKDAAKEEILRVGTNELRVLEGHMRGLELVANVAPLLGLLGTVMGMVDAFAALESGGSRVDPSLLAGGIWTALLTTVAGLIVAIPALMAYSVFDGKIDNVRHAMRDVTTRALALGNNPASTASAAPHATTPPPISTSFPTVAPPSSNQPNTPPVIA